MTTAPTAAPTTSAADEPTTDTTTAPTTEPPAATTAATRLHTFVDSPIGTLRLVADNGMLVGLFMDAQRQLPATSRFGTRDDDAAPFAAVRSQLTEYFAGERTVFDVPLRSEGTAFQQQVWGALRAIPYGQTRTYGELAAAIGAPRAARAVGLANAHNPIAVIVPCHRVVGADGSLTGYAGGLERKQRLLDLESVGAVTASRAGS